MNNDQIAVEVIDKRLQVNMDEEEGVHREYPQNEFMNEQGFESKDGGKQQKYEDEQDEEPQYKLSKLLPKQNQKERLIQQNIKLKTQIYQLAKQLDQILIRQKSKKQSYGIGLTKIDEEDELIRQKRLQLQKQQIEITEMKNKIFVAKRQLQSVYNSEVIMAKEDELKNLKAKLKMMEDEKEGHMNIQKVQTKALKIVRNEEQYGQKLNMVKTQCNRLKKESKVLIEKISITQKLLMKTHDQYVGRHQKIKQLEQKLALNKEKAKNKKPTQQTINEQMIQQLEAEVKRMEQQRKQGEKVWQEKIKAIEVELILKRSQEQKKLLILREKQKQLRLNELRIRQLRKLVRQGQTGGDSKKQSQQMDMSQFRHKRNIRYIEK